MPDAAGCWRTDDAARLDQPAEASVRVGAILPIAPTDGRPMHARHFADSARMIEEAGLASAWTFDAIGRGFMLPDPLQALTIAATVTTRIELGTGVLQLPLRNVSEVAHRALMVHLLAEGRLLLGVGCGSTESDFNAFGGDYAGRMARFGEQVPELQDALRTGRVNGVDLAPWPAAVGGPKVLIGAWLGPWVGRAATEHDGWIASAAKTKGGDDAIAERLARYRAAGGTRAVITNIHAAADLGPTLDRLDRFADLGFDDAVVFDLALDEKRAAAFAARSTPDATRRRQP